MSPSPGPTSRTMSCSVTPDAATILRTVFASVTKFWPSCLVGRRPNWLASSRIAVGSSSPPATR